jgi:fimbrial isopeptide formation D2 family protein
MIVDVTNPLPDQDTRSAVMFQVVGDTEITSKHTGTTIVKKTQDINDSTGEQPKDGDSVWIDSADYDIGDTVPFKSTATFEGMANYETYKVVITDIMAKGLTYNNDMTITINGQPCTTGFTINVEENYESDDEYKGGTVITVTFDNIKGLNGVENSAEIVLNYTAILNEDANFGAAGNPNKIKATTKPDGTGETPWDVNIVFTYKLDTTKGEMTAKIVVNCAGVNSAKLHNMLSDKELTIIPR